jgi:hypothetical protein
MNDWHLKTGDYFIIIGVLGILSVVINLFCTNDFTVLVNALLIIFCSFFIVGISPYFIGLFLMFYELLD